MSLKTKLFSEGTHITVTLGLAFLLVSVIVGATIWIATARGDIDINSRAIELDKLENGIEHGNILDLIGEKGKEIDENADDINDIRPVLVEIKTDLKWIRADLESRR